MARGVLSSLVVLWLAGVFVGSALLAEYSNAPSDGGAAPSEWPADCPLELDAQRPTLVLFAHPRCPCTRATFGELSKLLARCPDRARVQVVFYRPAQASPSWSHTDLWEAAAALPGVDVRADPGGAIASRFGARTSGQLLAYDSSGQLRYTGGLTPARGHHGDNDFANSVATLLKEGQAPISTGLVFGCPLNADCSEVAERLE